ncbi:Hypothetical predicted protein, partial [Olea europaea subsp. europaea]
EDTKDKERKENKHLTGRGGSRGPPARARPSWIRRRKRDRDAWEERRRVATLARFSGAARERETKKHGKKEEEEERIIRVDFNFFFTCKGSPRKANSLCDCVRENLHREDEEKDEAVACL